MNVTKDMVNNMLPRIDVVRRQYIGPVTWTLKSAYVYSYDNGETWDVHLVAHGDGIPARLHLGFYVGFDAADIFVDWMNGNLDRAEVIDLIVDKINNKLSKAP